MWMELALAMCVTAALLYVPGYALLRALRISRPLALAAAPLPSVCAYATLPIAYYELGIRCSPTSVALPVLGVSLIAFGLSRWRAAKRPAPDLLSLSSQRPMRLGGRVVPYDLLVPACYVLVAIVVCACVFLRALPNAAAFFPRFDNQTHLNLSRSFLESGCWSSLHTSSFLAEEPTHRALPGDGGFYPAAWNVIVVLTCLVARVDLMVAVNAAVALTASVVFPLGAYAFLRALLPDERRAVALSVIATTGFANWPWHYIYTGPLYPNQLGISLQVGALALALVWIAKARSQQASRVDTATGVLLGLMSFVALALAHPTTLFSCYVFLACFGARVLWVTLARDHRRTGLMAAYAAGIVAFWIVCYQLPMLQSVIGYLEEEQEDLGTVLTALLSMHFDLTCMQGAMVFLVWVGIVVVAQKPAWRWLLAPVAFFALGYVATRCDWTPVKHWICGLWYSDRRRMAVNATLFAMPVVALGLDVLLESCRERSRGTWIAAVTAIVVCVYAPNVDIPALGIHVDTPLGTVSQLLAVRYREPIYSPDEVAFVNRVVATIPDDALAINAAPDGSLWAYAVNDLHTLFRSIRTGGQTPEAIIIRERLDRYATDASVREAVRSVGATYVLQLDQAVNYSNGVWLWQFEASKVRDWAGIFAVRDDTPGFSVVLSEGDMRLYRIDAT